MQFEVNFKAFPRTMRLSGALSSKLFYFWTPQRSLIARRSSFSSYNFGSRDKFERQVSKVIKALNDGSIPIFIEEQNIKIKKPNFEQFRARFPCIRIGNSSPIQFYEKTENVEKSEKFAKWEEFAKSEKIEESKNLENLKKLEKVEKIEKIQKVEKIERIEKVQKIEKIENPVLKEKISLEKEIEIVKANEKFFIQRPQFEISSPWQNILDQSVKCIPGISSLMARKLENSGFHTVRKLLNHFPRMYADQKNARGPIEDGHYFMSVGSVISSKGIKGGQLGIHEVIVSCEFQDSDSDSNKTIYLHLKSFYKGMRFTNYGFLNKIASRYKQGDQVYVSGKVRKMRAENHYEMREYNMGLLLEEKERYKNMKEKPYPVYPSKFGLKPEFILDVISRALKILSYAIDPMPSEVLNKFNLLNLYDAYECIHSPKTLNDADLARRRLIFDEFFYLQLARLFQMLESLGTSTERAELLQKYENNEINKVCVSEWAPHTRSFLNSLPYSLTNSQLNAVNEIVLDLKRPVPMNRLLQGDVGCGKTIVAFLACMEVIASGFQAAFMAPTELLAIQHFDLLNTLLSNLTLNPNNPKTALLTGSTPSRESKLIYKGLQNGEISFVIGTHSLISEKIEFSNLRIAVIDEQHRFGVIQRGRFNNKLFSRLREESTDSDTNSEEDKSYMAPHILAMSATPIPRTLALALYGDMSLTQITDLPPGRQAIETLVFEGNDTGFEKAFQMMEDELADGGKVYIVYPIIEESEQLPQLHAAATDYESVAGKFKGYDCGLLHGRMKSEEKDEALRQFRDGRTQLLLATQVIEIGVDVPDASMMVVVNAERFGIAQLHQLRGRVGRGTRKSRCILLSSTTSATERLKVLERSSDGFYLANADLLLRGPGDLLGKKQSGHLPEFPVARLELDGNILQEAHLAALTVLGTSNDLNKYPGLKAELSMRQPLCILGD